MPTFAVAIVNMRILIISVWTVVAFYWALCIWIPEIRFQWQGSWFASAKKLGTLSCVGFTITFLGSWLIFAGTIAGLLSPRFFSATYAVGLLGIMVAMIGGWV